MPAQAQRRTDLDGPTEALGGEIELAFCQPANVIGRATFCRHQLLSRVDRGGRTHAAINMRRAVGHDPVVDPFGQLGRENHAQSVFPRLRRQRQGARLASSTGLRRGEVLCLVEHIEPAG